MLSEKVGSSLFLLSNHSTKQGLLLLKELFRVKGQAHSSESAHATCHQYCNIHKGKAHFLSIINSWPMGHMQGTREKILGRSAARVPTVGKAGQHENTEKNPLFLVCNTRKRYLNFFERK